MGVAGAGMSALAVLVRRRGVAVTGCDRDPDGPGGAASSGDVRRAGGVVVAGHDPSHVEGAQAVVVTAAVPPDHAELERARALGIPVVRRADALAAAIAPGQVVAVAGTHGKTTTTAMTTEALAAAGLDPTGIAGGRIASWSGNTRLGGNAIFVVEADEYDKSFLALSAEVAVINNVEADHLECYGSLESLEDAFVQFARPARRVIAGADDAGASRVAARDRAPDLDGRRCGTSGCAHRRRAAGGLRDDGDGRVAGGQDGGAAAQGARTPQRAECGCRFGGDAWRWAGSWSRRWKRSRHSRVWVAGSSWSGRSAG